MVQVIRGSVGEDKGDVWRRPGIGPVERGAQTAQRNELRMALRKGRRRRADCYKDRNGENQALAAFHVVSPQDLTGPGKLLVRPNRGCYRTEHRRNRRAVQCLRTNILDSRASHNEDVQCCKMKAHIRRSGDATGNGVERFGWCLCCTFQFWPF